MYMRSKQIHIGLRACSWWLRSEREPGQHCGHLIIFLGLLVQTLFRQDYKAKVHNSIKVWYGDLHGTRWVTCVSILKSVSEGRNMQLLLSNMQAYVDSLPKMGSYKYGRKVSGHNPFLCSTACIMQWRYAGIILFAWQGLPWWSRKINAQPCIHEI